MNKRKLLLIIPLLLIANLGLAWVTLKILATPAPSGEPYTLVTDWPQLPEGMALGQVSGVGVDSQGQVFVFHRAERVWQGENFGLDKIAAATVAVLDGESGALISQWGADTFVIPHSLTIDQDDNLWLTDVGLHQVFKFDRAGNLLLVLGEPGVPGNDETHFNMPTDVAIAADGSFYVSDGYGNARVIHFSATGEFLRQWGTAGDGPGQFSVPHGLALDAQGQVYVADRGNARLQIFTAEGEWVTTWAGGELGRPWTVRLGPDGAVYVVDGGDQREFWPDRGRVLKLDDTGNLLAAFGAYGAEPGQFIWPHALALAPDGSIYVGEVATGMRIQKFRP
jgi:peptidylamidoglycolate lyase